jgi:hypothetical protein
MHDNISIVAHELEIEKSISLVMEKESRSKTRNARQRKSQPTINLFLYIANYYK